MRVYVPRPDVVPSVLVPSATRTQCPYKGETTYWSLELDRGRVDDAAWTCPTPLPEAMRVAGHVCFLHDDVDVELGDAPRRAPA